MTTTNGKSSQLAMLKRRRFLQLSSASSLLVGAGGLASPAIAQGGSDTITVGVEAGSPLTEFYVQNIEDFKNKTGLNVEWLQVPIDSMLQRFLTEEISGGGSIDVYMTDQPWIAQMAAQGFMMPLNDKVADLDDFSPAALNTCSYDGGLYALPFLVHNPVLFYRTDLFEAAGIAVPTNWTEYVEAATALTEGDVYGTVIEGKQAREPGQKFLDVLFQAGGSVLSEDGSVVTLDDGAAVEAFKMYLDVQYDRQASPPGAPGWYNFDSDIAFKAGTLAMYPNWPYLFAAANDPSGSKVAGDFSVAVQPGLVRPGAVAQSWGYGVSANSKKSDAALEFVEWTASTDLLTRASLHFSVPAPRFSSGEQIQADTSLSDEQKHAISVFAESLEIGTTTPNIPKWPQVFERVQVALSRVMTQQADPEPEVAAAADDIRAML